jgi:hypothetical protein
MCQETVAAQELITRFARSRTLDKLAAHVREIILSRGILRAEMRHDLSIMEFRDQQAE